MRNLKGIALLILILRDPILSGGASIKLAEPLIDFFPNSRRITDIEAFCPAIRAKCAKQEYITISQLLELAMAAYSEDIQNTMAILAKRIPVQFRRLSCCCLLKNIFLRR